MHPDHAIRHGERLLQEGADWLEVSGQSSNTNSELVSEKEEWERVAPFIRHFVSLGVSVSLDSFRPNVQIKGLEAGVRAINDISGFSFPGDRKNWETLGKNYPHVKWITMHSANQGIAKNVSPLTPDKVLREVQNQFRERRTELLSWSISESAIVYDPGMGFFLSPDPLVSFEILSQLEILRMEFPQMMVSVSNKSFLGNALGGLPVADRGAATLACELHLLRSKVPYIRTHNVLALRQAEKIWKLCQKEVLGT